MTARDITPHTAPSIRTRLAAVEAGIKTAMGLTHAAKSIGDLRLPDSHVDATELAACAYTALAPALEHLYWVVSLDDREGAAVPSPLERPAPTDDEAQDLIDAGVAR